MQIPGDRLHDRFNRLRKILHDWEVRMEQLPLFVLDCFERGDLAGIKALIEERRILQERIRLLKKFIEKWENPDFYSVLGVTKPEDDKARNILS